MTRAQYLVAALAACGSGDESDPIDVADAPIPADARIDATPPPDAVPSSVMVVAGPCPGGGDHQLTNLGSSFVFDGAMNNPPIAIDVGETIQYQSSLGHNFVHINGAAGPNGFRSGPLSTAHTACLTFTAAFTASYVCEAHVFMTNTLTVQ